MPDQLFGGPIIRAKTTNERLADYTSGREYDQNPTLLNMLAALFPSLAGMAPGPGAGQAASPLAALTKYRRFYHGSPARFDKFRSGRLNPEFPTMPVDGAVYVTPDPRLAVSNGSNLYEVALKGLNKVSDWWGDGSSDSLDDMIYNLFAKKGHLDVEDMKRLGADAIRYDGGGTSGPRSYSLAVTDPDKLQIIRRIDDPSIIERIRNFRIR